MPGRIVNANLYAEHLMNAFFARLHVARKKLGLLIDLLHCTIEDRVRKRINAYFRLLPELNAAILGFRNINADVSLILLEKRRDRRVGSNQVARADIEHFDDCRGRRDDLPLAETRLVQSVSSFSLLDVFSAI